MAEFEASVRSVLERLPPGETFSYAWVASEAGYPGRARAVGGLLASGLDDLPWWRVVRANGTMAEHLVAEQSARLRMEGVETINGRVCDHTNHVPRVRSRH